MHWWVQNTLYAISDKVHHDKVTSFRNQRDGQQWSQQGPAQHLEFAVQLLEAYSILCLSDIVQLPEQAGGPLVQQGRQVTVHLPEALHVL